MPAADDVNITAPILSNNYAAFVFATWPTWIAMRPCCVKVFELISRELARLDQVFVDTKFEFGCVTDRTGRDKLIYMDEVGHRTPRVSGTGRRGARAGWWKIPGGFPPTVAAALPDPDILLNKDRMPERMALAGQRPAHPGADGGVRYPMSGSPGRFSARSCISPTTPGRRLSRYWAVTSA